MQETYEELVGGIEINKIKWWIELLFGSILRKGKITLWDTVVLPVVTIVTSKPIFYGLKTKATSLELNSRPQRHFPLKDPHEEDKTKFSTSMLLTQPVKTKQGVRRVDHIQSVEPYSKYI